MFRLFPFRCAWVEDARSEDSGPHVSFFRPRDLTSPIRGVLTFVPEHRIMTDHDLVLFRRKSLRTSKMDGEAQLWAHDVDKSTYQ